MKKEPVKRLAPSKETLKLLFSLCGNECAFPGCQHPVYSVKNKLIAQVCHIESAAEGGERFNPDSSNEERRSFNNLLVLCYEHHVETDDVAEYPIDRMRQIKSGHEDRCRNRFKPSPSQIDEAFEIELRKAFERIEYKTDIIISKQDEHSNILGSLDTNVAALLAKLDAVQSGQTDYNQKIDEIFLLRGNQQQRAAISLFDSLKSTSWSNLSAHEKYRLTVLKGVCHLDLNEVEFAKGLFFEGYHLQPENVKAIYYGILGHMLDGNEEAALFLAEKGLKLDPTNSGIISSLIRLNRGKSLQEILSLIPEGMRNDVEVAFEVAVCMLNIKQYDEAISWHHIALKNNTGPHHDLKASLASVILESIFDKFRVFTNQITQEMRNKAEYILQLYNEAWAEISNSELRMSRTWYLMNRGIAKKLTGNFDGFYEDSFEAFLINPDYATTRHFYMVCNELRNKPKAEELLEALKVLANEEQLHEVLLFEGQFLFDIDNYEKALGVYQDLLGKDISQLLRKTVLLELVSYYLSIKNYELAESYNCQLGELAPEEISYQTLQARIDAALGRTDFGAALLEIFKKVNDETLKSHLEVLANDLAKTGMIREAINLNERVTEKLVYSSQSVKLINLYLEAGESRKVLSMAKDWLEKYGPIRDVTTVVAYVYESINDVNSAIATYNSYLDVYPGDQQISYHLATIYRRENHMELLQATLESFTHLDQHLTMDAQYNLAVMMHNCGFVDKAYAFAYQTRRQFFDSAAAHDRFVALSTTFDQADNHPTDPLEITRQCAVIVETDGKRHDYIIQQAEDLVKSRGEISPDSFEGKILIGKKVGDQVILASNQPEHASQILGIQHLYNYAFVQSMDMSFSVFAGETRLKRFQTGSSGDFKEDFKELFKNLDDLQQYNASIEENYKKGSLPIGAIASIKRENPINIWLMCISNPSMGLTTSSDAQEHFSGSNTLLSTAPIMLDIISLCTIFFTDVHLVISRLPNKLIVAAASLTEINDIISELEKIRPVGSMTLGKVNGAYIRHIRTPEDIHNQIKRFLTLKAWIETNCEILPCESALDMNAHEKTKYDKAIGESFVDSILTARAQEAIFLSEESSLRGLAYQEFGISGVATFTLLLFMNKQRTISVEEYREATIKLIAMYYRVIPVTSQTLLKIAHTSGYKFNPVIEQAFEGLLSNILPPDKGAEFGAQFIFMVYSAKVDFIIDTNFEEYRRFVCVKCLDTLCRKYISKDLASYLDNYFQNPVFAAAAELPAIKRLLKNYFS